MTSILVCGTWDTKDAELGYIRDVILRQGGRRMTMDVSVLGDPSQPDDQASGGRGGWVLHRGGHRGRR